MDVVTLALAKKYTDEHGGSASSWDSISGKPFNTIGDGLSVENDELVVDDIMWENKEDKTNKVTTISSSSTNEQYPSALAVNNFIENKIAAAIGNAIGGEY